MRIAVLSDIHGNCIALDEVLSDLRTLGVEQLVCLGDAIQGGPQPAQVISHLRKLGCPVVMGNADSFLLSGAETGGEVTTVERRLELNSVRVWTLSRLSPADRSFIQSFQPTVRIPLQAGRILLCFHGSPASFDDVILPDISQETLFAFLGAHVADVMTGGHTHVQHLRRIDESARFFLILAAWVLHTATISQSGASEPIRGPSMQSLNLTAEDCRWSSAAFPLMPGG